MRERKKGWIGREEKCGNHYLQHSPRKKKNEREDDEIPIK
jgi:hypothetical protein